MFALAASKQGLRVASGSMTLLAAEVLADIASQAEEADRTRSVSPSVISMLKSSPVMTMSASRELGGLESTVLAIGRELGAVAAACGSTAWCLWNHLSVFHLFAGALGPGNIDVLLSIVENREWVEFPAGAGSRLYGKMVTEFEVELCGPTMFGSGARYAEWVGAAFAITGPADRALDPTPDLRFTVVRIDGRRVRVDPTWDGVGREHRPQTRCITMQAEFL